MTFTMIMSANYNLYQGFIYSVTDCHFYLIIHHHLEKILTQISAIEDDIFIKIWLLHQQFTM